MPNISLGRKRGECWTAAVVVLYCNYNSPFRCKLPTDLTDVSVNTDVVDEDFTCLYVVFDPAIP